MNQVNNTEEQLRSEVEALRRQVDEQRKLLGGKQAQPKGPSATTLVLIAVVTIALVVAGFFLGYVPRQRREAVLAAEASAEVQNLPVVDVIPENNLLLVGGSIPGHKNNLVIVRPTVSCNLLNPRAFLPR